MLCVLVIFIGCTSKEERTTRHLNRAKQYVVSNDYKKAVLELKNGIRLDPEPEGLQWFPCAARELIVLQPKQAIQRNYHVSR